MKTRQQSLHDEGGQLRVGEDGDSQKLDDVRVEEGAHQLALLYKANGGFFDVLLVELGVVLEEVVHLFHGADSSPYLDLIHAAVGSGPYLGASKLYMVVGDQEWRELGITGRCHLNGATFAAKGAYLAWEKCTRFSRAMLYVATPSMVGPEIHTLCVGALVCCIVSEFTLPCSQRC